MHEKFGSNHLEHFFSFFKKKSEEASTLKKLFSFQKMFSEL